MTARPTGPGKQNPVDIDDMSDAETSDETQATADRPQARESQNAEGAATGEDIATGREDSDARAETDEQAREATDTWGQGFKIDKGKAKGVIAEAMQSDKATRGRIKLIPGPVKPGRRELEEHMVCHIP